MASRLDYIELKLAYQRMCQLRYCPPLEELTEEHKRRCPFDHFPSEFFPKAKNRVEAVEIGQIWRTEALGYDEDCNYVNAALVLVTNIISDDVVRVALVHTEPELATPGDVNVHGCFFAEMWNTFPFPTARLEHFVMKVKVPELRRDVSASKSLPSPVHEHFRRMEADMATRLVMKTWDEIIREWEPDVADILVNLQEHLTIEARLPDGVSDILDGLALAIGMDEPLAMAAAEREDEVAVLPVNVAYLSRMRVYLKTVPGRITFWRDNGGELVIGGEVPGEYSDDAAMHAVWKDKESNSIIAHARFVQFDSRLGFFRVVFSDLMDADKARGIPALLVCTR